MYWFILRELAAIAPGQRPTEVVAVSRSHPPRCRLRKRKR
jgi:hypothetical protein